MTNVKLKLMFCLLNSLLTGDVVSARPYYNNGSDVIITANASYIPVDSNSDTLVVADDEDSTDGENYKETRADIDESDEEVRGEGNNHENTKMSRSDEEKRNISTLLDEIIDSETNRDDIITDLLYKPESDFEGVPKYEFLIAKMNESIYGDNLMERDKNNSDVLRKVDYVELVEVMKSSNENKSAYMMNITEHEVEDDLAPDTSEYIYLVLLVPCTLYNDIHPIII